MVGVDSVRWGNDPGRRPESSAFAPLYRLCRWDTHGIGDYPYTISEAERDDATARLGYRLDGVLGLALTRWRMGAIPLYRLWGFRVNRHAFTIDAARRATALVAPSWRNEGTAGYLLATAGDGTVPLFLLSHRDGPVLLTTSPQGRDAALVSGDFSLEASDCFLLAAADGG